MAENKTQPTKASVSAFVNAIDDPEKRADARAIAAMMRRVTGKRPKMWGPSIVGYGTYHYKYASGREGDWFLTGFSPRKQNLTLYIMSGFSEYEALLSRLGKFKIGKSCLYINKIEDIDLPTLKELIHSSVQHVVATNP